MESSGQGFMMVGGGGDVDNGVLVMMVMVVMMVMMVMMVMV